MKPQATERLKQRLEETFGEVPQNVMDAYVRILWNTNLEDIARGLHIAKKVYKELPTPHQFMALLKKPEKIDRKKRDKIVKNFEDLKKLTQEKGT